MGRRIIYFSIAIAIILLLAFMQGGCGNALLENLIVDVERATNNILIINTDGNGTTVPSGEVIVKSGEVVNISATPNTGYVFISWTGTGITFGNRYSADTTVSLAGKTATITANFADALSVLNLTVNSGGNGVTNPSGTIFALPANPVSITATPDFGYEFVNWEIIGGVPAPVFGDENSANTTVTVSAVSSIIQANFNLLQYQLNVTNDGNGTTTPSGDVTVDHGVPQSITATPATDYIFKNWNVESGTADIDNSSSASTTATLTNGPATIMANFEYGFKLFYGAWKPGSISINRCYSDWTNHQVISSINVGPMMGIVLDKGGKKVYLTDAQYRKIQRCDFDLSDPTGIVNTGLFAPYGIALDTANNVLYWSDFGMPQVKSIDLGSMDENLIADYQTVPQCRYPQGMAFHNNKVFWVERQYRLIFEYDVVTQGLTSWSIAGMNVPTDIAISPSRGNSGYLYCTDNASPYFIHIFDIESKTFVNSFTGPWYKPMGIAIDDQNGLMYITSPFDSEV